MSTQSTQHCYLLYLKENEEQRWTRNKEILSSCEIDIYIRTSIISWADYYGMPKWTKFNVGC